MIPAFLHDKAGVQFFEDQGGGKWRMLRITTDLSLFIEASAVGNRRLMKTTSAPFQRAVASERNSFFS